MSGGHYPSSFNHIQPSQEYIAPRHRLPTIAPPRPTSPYNSIASITQAHSSNSSWINKRSYPSNYPDNAGYYPQSVSRNYRPVSRAHSNEESSCWTNPHLAATSTVGNALFHDLTQTEKMESTTPNNIFSKDDIQQESIDLSSTTHIAAINQSTKLVNPELKISCNGEKNTDVLNEILISTVNGSDSNKSDSEITDSNKETVVSVIAPNPLKSVCLVNSENSMKPACNVTSACDGLSESKDNADDNDSAVKLDKCNKNLVPSDNVESVLETMFHSDNKLTSGLSSVIVSTQSCKTTSQDLRAESVEKILKSPSPEKNDNKNVSRLKFNFEDSETIDNYNLELLKRKELGDIVKNEKLSNITSNALSTPSLKKDHESNSKSSDFKNISNSVSCSKQTNVTDTLLKTTVDKTERSVGELSRNESNSNIEEVSEPLQGKVSDECTTEKQKIKTHKKSDQVQDSEQKSTTTNLSVITAIGPNDFTDFILGKNVESKKSELSQNSENDLIVKNAEDFRDKKILNSNVELNKNRTDSLIKEQQLSKSKTRNEEITYVEVESELEKMFAGIEDTEVNEIDIDPLKSLPGELSNANVRVPQSDLSDIKGNIQYSQKSTHSFNNLSVITKINKKNNSKKLKSNNSSKNLKDTKVKPSSSLKENTSVDITSKRIPVIHVQGSKENPISTQIINSIKLEEDDFSDAKIAAKRKFGKSDQAAKRQAASYVVKNYDPGTSDASWICVFCKLSAQSPGIAGEPTGDLFGPYFIKNPDQDCEDNESKRHSRKANHLEQVKKKQKRSISVESSYYDSSVSTEQKSLEIWAHENCIIWASGVHLIGSKLIGLEEAVSEALQTTCAHCSNKGASIGCKARHCKSCVHYSCALYTGWSLDTDTFISTCNVHKIPH